MHVKDSIVLITGANRGIGKAYAEEFLKQGAGKIYLGVRDPSSVAEFASQDPDKLIPLKLDVTNPSDIKAAAETATDVTILVNNAGILRMNSTFGENTLQEAQEELDVNYFGPFRMIQAFAPILKANGGGAIATVGSIVSFVSFPGIPTYSASKAAAHFLILAARMELEAQGTQVIGVYPGPIETDMGANVPMDKFPPSLVAQETIKAIENGVEYVFPDAFSQEMFNKYQKDMKAVERELRDMHAHAAEAA